ncbi:MAG: methionine synthase [Phycisphaerae bacterium]|nr:MAG: methionine synthase [Planctomycetota bacterium]KAB2945858.1 MAG: methionine synthase [Phycisphaerae bacterium]MBE7455905.1 methionine synthase [Planctomycetia bacterium]MCK6465242.1 methionine synthase [Phycisphaerae bacterium]MCL4717163.1 methionine synthase [Phycisphaerae bacterium]
MESRILAAARERVLVLDGAMGTSIHARELTLADYDGHENCVDVVSLTRPDVIADIHRSFLSVGCDGVMTNTFGASKLTLGEFGIADKTYAMNRASAEIARRVADEFSKPAQPRFVVGSMGPGTKLITLGQTHWDEMLDSYTEQARGLLDGGVDALLVETCQDILEAKCAIVACLDARRGTGRAVPIFCTVTIETTGTMLLGTEIAAAVTMLNTYDEVAAIGLNCATGPQEMSEYVRYLSRSTDKLLLVQPNAGLPQLVDGKPHYALTPAELARWLREFVETDGVNLVGGCCGTTPQHLAAVVDAVTGRPPRKRSFTLEPSVSSLYQSVTLRQENDILAIGERTNANGSKKFRELLAAGDLDGMVRMGREQVKHGSHCLDVCTAYVGRDEVGDMMALLKRFVTDVTVPLVIDSTETNVLEAALKLAGGKCIINSINLEDGEGKADTLCRFAKRYGAALIALTIDEEGMAKTADRKVEVARRIHDIAVKRHGIKPSDLIFDPLTFTVCTGNEDDRRLALETLDGLRRIKAELPGVHTVLGVSNVSFGVAAPIRKVINSVMLHHAREHGLDAAILHVAGIEPLFRIPEAHRRTAEDLIFDRRRDDYDPLTVLLNMFAEPSRDREGADPSRGLQPARSAESEKPRDIRERLKRRIIDGDRVGLEDDLDEAMTTYRPLDIINDILLDGMKTVGDLFGAGQMQLPFVLQSAETMKASVKHLEPHMDRVQGEEKGSIVLATVRGDVHDIGKNLVDIILTNNGYKVVNLGIKQPISAIIDAYEQHQADAIGMSGLLVKSTVVMKENLEVLNERGLAPNVILGGAALTRKYVEDDLRNVYDGAVAYAKDAFEGLHLMEQIVEGRFEETTRRTGRASLREAPGEAASGKTSLRDAHQTSPPLDRPRTRDRSSCGTPFSSDVQPPEDVLSERGHPRERAPLPPVSDISRVEPVPVPPFWGSRVVEHIPVKTVLGWINENMLFQVQWGYRKNRRTAEEFARYVNDVVRPVYRDLVERCEREDILKPQAIYGFWPCQAEGDELVIYDPAGFAPPGRSELDAGTEDRPSIARDRFASRSSTTVAPTGPLREIVRFEFPRQRKAPYWCLADFFRPAESGVYDVIAFHVVTMGRRVSDVAREWFACDRYQDYLHLHGLGVEGAEALAEFIHKQIRAEWGVGDEDAREKQEIFKQRYRGSRYSFGYPACPRLEDQLKLWPLLEPGRIGVTLSEEFQLEPEQTTTALVTHHRQAKYFTVL